MIEFINGKWTVTGPDGSIIGRFDTREAAMQAAQNMGMKTQNQQPQWQGGGMGFSGGGLSGLSGLFGGGGQVQGQPPQQQQGGGGQDIMGLVKALLGGM